LGIDHFDDARDQWARGVVFATVSPGIAHVFDFPLIEMGHFMLFGIGSESKRIDSIDHFPKVVATLDSVF
jgi:hypothetical protein